MYGLTCLQRFGEVMLSIARFFYLLFVLMTNRVRSCHLVRRVQAAAGS